MTPIVPPKLRKERGDLAAMMSLVVEEVRDEKPEVHLARLGPQHAREVQLAGELLVAQALRPALDVLIRRTALGAQRAEVRVEPYRGS